MLIMFRLGQLIVLALIIYGVYRLGKLMFKLADEHDLQDTKEDIEHKASLNEDVDEYVDANSDTIEKANSDSYNEFLGKK